MDGWQDISTAPKDGTPIIALRVGQDARMASIIYWDGPSAEWAGRNGEDERRIVKAQPTHWMPLPEPPAA